MTNRERIIKELEQLSNEGLYMALSAVKQIDVDRAACDWCFEERRQCDSENGCAGREIDWMDTEWNGKRILEV